MNVTVQDSVPDDRTLDQGTSRAATRLLARVVAHAGRWAIVLAVNAVVLAVAELALPAVLGRTVDAVLLPVRLHDLGRCRPDTRCCHAF